MIISVFCVGVCTHTHMHSVMIAALWTVAHHVPLSWDFPGKNTGVYCHFLLQFHGKALNEIVQAKHISIFVRCLKGRA